MYYLNHPGHVHLVEYERSRTLFVDKTELIHDIYEYARTTNRFISITKPRRFGKTMAANLITAFFSKGLDASSAFSGLKIAQIDSMKPLMNTVNVFHLDFLDVLAEVHSFEAFIKLISIRIRRDLREANPDLVICDDDDIPSVLSKTCQDYMFILDEWDAIFEMDFMTDEDRMGYLLFLRDLFGERPYVRMALLTGILPVAKYTGASPLDMFHEFNTFGLVGFEQYYGFSEDEILHLIEQRHLEKPSLDEIRLWYDGYVRRSDGVHMFNPDSVNKALSTGICQNYWSGTGNLDDISNLIAADAFSIREDILKMTAGEKLPISLPGFGALEKTPTTKKDLLAAMVVYGFLTYHDNLLSIPNLELSQKFSHVLERGTLGLFMTLEESRSLLQATIAGDSKATAVRIEEIHDQHIPFIHYSDENSLACVIMYAYYAAADCYDVRREQPSGKGYVDFLFLPIDRKSPPIVMELKYNHSARSAIAQIRHNHYILSLKKYPEVLFVGINYSERTKKHTCIIEKTNYTKEMSANV